MKFLGEGGVGSALSNFNFEFHNFCLKIIKRSNNANENQAFWNAAKATSAWTALIRFNSQFSKIPLAQQFWIKANDCSLLENPKTLSSLLKNCKDGKTLGDYENCPNELKDINPNEYILCPDSLLEDIYKNDIKSNIKNYSLLLTYPIQQGKKTVAKSIDKGESFSPQDLLDCCYQILTSIYYLYRKNSAHRDIKPGNIIVDEEDDDFNRKHFRLIDFDAFHSQLHTSYAASDAFLPDEIIQQELKSKYSPLEYRVLLDCFSLAATILCMASKVQNPQEPNTIPIYKLPKEVKKLYEISKLKIEDIPQILADLKDKHNCTLPNLKYHQAFYSIAFDETRQYHYCNFGEPGTFHEQIRFSEVFDPIIKVPKTKNHLPLPQELYDIFLIPIVEDWENIYIHAPDDRETGKMPQDFSTYRPKSLENTQVTAEEKALLISYAKKLNEFYQTFDNPIFLPLKQHIIWCDGTIKLLWNVGHKINKFIDFENYFLFLLGEKVNFSYSDWRTLLSLFPELGNDSLDYYWQQILDEVTKYQYLDYSWLYQNAQFNNYVISNSSKLTIGQWLILLRVIPNLESKLTIKICRQLIEEFTKYKTYAWLFSLPTFKKKIAKEKLSFDAEHYLEIQEYTNEFDCQIADTIALEMFKIANPKQREKLRTSILYNKIKNNIQSDPKECTKEFLLGHQYDIDKFLTLFSPLFSKLTIKQWGKLIAVNPQVIEYMSEEKLIDLNKSVWVRILGYNPAYIEKCPHINNFSSKEWCSIIIQQTNLRKFLPMHITLSNDEEKRIKTSLEKL